MPLYEYQCLPNGHRFEIRHGYNDEPVQTCPECGGLVRRVIQPVGIVFKGSGFYATDSRSKTTSATTPKTSAPDTKPAEPTKSDTTSTSTGETKGD